MIVRELHELEGGAGKCMICHKPVTLEHVDDADEGTMPRTHCCDSPAYIIDRDTPTLASRGPAWAAFVAAPRVLFSSTQFKPAEKLVVLALLEYRFQFGASSVYPSQERLAEDVGLSRFTVRDALKALEARGLIGRRRRNDGRGRRTSDGFDVEPLLRLLNALTTDPVARAPNDGSRRQEPESRRQTLESDVLTTDPVIPNDGSRQVLTTGSVEELEVVEVEVEEKDEASPLRDDDREERSKCDEIDTTSEPLSPAERAEVKRLEEVHVPSLRRRAAAPSDEIPF